MTFAEKLEFLIEHRKTSQSRLSRQTGIAQSAISAMTRDERRPYLDQAFLLARALGVSVDYLADEAQVDPPIIQTDQERAVWAIIRAIGPDRALLRLVEDAESEPRLVPPPALPKPKLGESSAS